MLTEYDIHQAHRERTEALERDDRRKRLEYESFEAEARYAHENAARRNVRLKAERTQRGASRLDAYVAKRRRELGAQAVLDVAEQTSPYDWEQAGV